MKWMDGRQSTSNATLALREATNILNILNDESCMFYLELFHQILHCAEVIFLLLQCRNLAKGV